MTLRFVRPAPVSEDNPELRQVRDPATGQPLPAEGLEVTWSDYWTRRQLDGDVLFDKPAKAKSQTSKEA